jgi:hypothetical protein
MQLPLGLSFRNRHRSPSDLVPFPFACGLGHAPFVKNTLIACYSAWSRAAQRFAALHSCSTAVGVPTRIGRIFRDCAKQDCMGFVRMSSCAHLRGER